MDDYDSNGGYLLDNDDFEFERRESEENESQHSLNKRTKLDDDNILLVAERVENLPAYYSTSAEPELRTGSCLVRTNVSEQGSSPQSSSHSLNFLNDTTTEGIFQIPTLFENALNTSNATWLSNVLEMYFKIDCAILYKAVDRLYGRNLIFQHYCALLNKFSNCFFQYTIRLRHHRLLVMTETCLGKIFPIMLQHDEKVEDLWRCFDLFNFESEVARLLYRKKFNDILYMNSLPVTFNLKVDLHMVLNDDMSQVENTMWELVSLDFSEDFYPDDSLN